MTERPIAVILAGGSSRRMGRDKALLEVVGHRLFDRLVATCLETGLHVAVSGRDAASLGHPTLPGIPDETPGSGPLEGLRCALRSLESDVLLLACDLPRLRAELLQKLCQQARGELGCILYNDGQPEPCCSIYRPAMLPLLEQARRRGQRSLIRLLDNAGFTRWDCPSELTSQLLNCNTPEDLASLTRDENKDPL